MQLGLVQTYLNVATSHLLKFVFLLWWSASAIIYVWILNVTQHSCCNCMFVLDRAYLWIDLDAWWMSYYNYENNLQPTKEVRGSLQYVTWVKPLLIKVAYNFWVCVNAARLTNLESNHVVVVGIINCFQNDNRWGVEKFSVHIIGDLSALAFNNVFFFNKWVRLWPGRTLDVKLRSDCFLKLTTP